MPSKHTEYERVNTDTESEQEQPTTLPSKGRWMSTVLYIFIGILISAVAMPFLSPQQCREVRMKQFITKPCGSSAAEAKAAGCIFDPMMNSWLSEDCYDEELSQEFRSLREWTFFTDENATRQLTAEEFSHAGDSWGTWEYHITHCVYAMRKLQRAITTGRKIERIVAREEHSAHCANVFNVTSTLMERAQMEGGHFSIQDMGTVLHTGYPVCIDPINMLPYDGVVI